MILGPLQKLGTTAGIVYLTILPAIVSLPTRASIDGEILSVGNPGLLDLFVGRSEDREQLKQSKF